jgi:transposase
MPWTEITRPKYRRDGLKYASDTTDEEWASITPFMPPPHRLGRPRETALRAVVNALFYVLSSGCQWRMLPRDFPPRSTVQGWFYRWRDDGTWTRINHHLLMAAREAVGREASPTAGVIDSQSVKTTEAGGPRGDDAGTNVKGYAGDKLKTALGNLGRWTLAIVKWAADADGFQVLPRRWVVERTLAWLNRNRRLAKDFEASIASAESWIMMASVKLLSRRLART